ncbi:MAG: hypothetical protein FRX49_01374 [Trebouxia sp. A1-2]|nr:MAG: hypothetical protein FRX49_01374 [Trebouxia sp. A1-2]
MPPVQQELSGKLGSRVHAMLKTGTESSVKELFNKAAECFWLFDILRTSGGDNSLPGQASISTQTDIIAVCCNGGSTTFVRGIAAAVVDLAKSGIEDAVAAAPASAEAAAAAAAAAAGPSGDRFAGLGNTTFRCCTDTGSDEMHLQYTDTDAPQQQTDAPISVSAAAAAPPGNDWVQAVSK